MEVSVSIALMNLRVYWDHAANSSPGWHPKLFHCGAYDPTRGCFPVLHDHSHIIYIPTTSKPIFRFLQHAMYALWFMSLCPRFSNNNKKNLVRGSAYLHLICQAFFKEICHKFYPPEVTRHQALPTYNKITRQWFSSVLFSWGQITYHTGRISPPDDDWVPPDDCPVSVKFGKCPPICSDFLH